ncbi:MAG TPA: PGPGW domain-containing protein [Rhizomicrobium sp.]
MTVTQHHQSTIRFGRFRVKVPGTRLQRTILGIGLCIGGVLGFLPIVGFWMLPLGILVLSLEYHPIRRLRRRFEVRWGRWRRKDSVAKKR